MLLIMLAPYVKGGQAYHKQSGAWNFVWNKKKKKSFAARLFYISFVFLFRYGVFICSFVWRHLFSFPCHSANGSLRISSSPCLESYALKKSLWLCDGALCQLNTFEFNRRFKCLDFEYALGFIPFSLEHLIFRIAIFIDIIWNFEALSLNE